VRHCRCASGEKYVQEVLLQLRLQGEKKKDTTLLKRREDSV
jgi:hypothetical protein